MWHTYMVKSTYMWMDGQYDVVEVEIRMWFISKFESGSFVDPDFFFLDEDLNTWLGSVALGSQLFQFFAPRGLDLGCGLFWWTSKGSNGRTSKRTGRGLKMKWTSKYGTFWGCLLGRYFINKFAG